jgi:hypothetical protein
MLGDDPRSPGGATRGGPIRHLPARRIGERTCTYAALGIGLAFAVAWFLQLSRFDAWQRLGGDAGDYVRSAAQFSGWRDAFAYVSERAVGFPLIVRLFLLLSPSVETAQGINAFLSIASLGLFTFHVLAVVGFVVATRRRYPQVHWLIGVPLLAYPGLVAHTTVPLTDTLCADLVMIALALLAWSRSLAASGAAGAVLAFAALCRPSYHPAVLASLLGLTLFLGVAGRSWRACIQPGVVVAAYLLLLLPAALHCQSRFGTLCLIDPAMYAGSLEPSLVTGLDSPRQYWSGHTTPDEQNGTCGPGCWTLRDATLTATWATHCDIDAQRFGYGLPLCFATRPDLGLLFLAKKTLAVYDSYQYQPYTVDRTPAWARAWSRPFSAFAYAGFVSAIASLLVFTWRRTAELPLLLAFLLTATLTFSHSITHIEGRYGYGAVPGALLAAAWAWNATAYRRQIRLVIVALVTIFVLQTAAWDRSDAVLQRIEAAL